MDQDDHRIFFTGLHFRGREKPSLNADPVVRPFDVPGLAPRWSLGRIVSGQLPPFTDWPGPSDINTLLNYLTQNYKIDLSRIYLTGLSMGGGVVWEYAGNNAVYANRLAAIVPICGASWPDQGRAGIMAGANLPVHPRAR